MNYDAAEFLLSPAGREILGLLADCADDPAAAGKHLRRIHPDIPPSFLAAASETAAARVQGRAKFARADERYLTREALEQATHEQVSRHRALRFEGLREVCDACCGIGGDAIALGKGAAGLTCVDIDPARLLFCGENLRLHGISACLAREDILAMKDDLARFDALFIDPSRRPGGRRTLDVERMEPPLGKVMELLARVPRGATKLPPALRREDIPPGCEIEWISMRDGLKEATLWAGEFRRCATTVTLLHRNASLTDRDLKDAEPETGEGAFLHEPDPALIRSGLLGRKAAALGMRLLDRNIAYTASDAPVSDPFFTSWRVIEALPFGMKRLERALNSHGAGTVTVKKRGFPLAPEDVVRALKLRGDRSLTVILARIGNHHRAYIVERAE
jgi:predicted RNA methylase